MPVLPDHVFATLEAVCAKYPGPASDETLGKVLNETAWIHRLENYGLSEKTGGRHIEHPELGPIAEDILQLPDGTHWDVLSAAGAGNPLRPNQGPSIVPNTPRRWLAPVNPGEVIIPPKPPIVDPPIVDPPVTPPPATCKFTGCQASNEVILARIGQLEAMLDNLISAVLIDVHVAEIYKKLGALQESVDKLPKQGCRLRG